MVNSSPSAETIPGSSRSASIKANIMYFFDMDFFIFLSPYQNPEDIVFYEKSGIISVFRITRKFSYWIFFYYKPDKSKYTCTNSKKYKPAALPNDKSGTISAEEKVRSVYSTE